MPIIIHTSDVHLGAPLGWLGPLAAEQREELRRTLTKIVDLVIDQQADALVISGNLFHSNSPSAANVRYVLRELSRISCDSRAHAVLLPGTQDSLESESVYASYRDELKQLDRVTVLGLDGRTTVDIESAGLRIHGDPSHHPEGGSTDHGISPDQNFTFNVALIHRTLGAAGDEMSGAGPLTSGELPREAWSYIALGGLGSWHEVEGAGVPAVYPGSPEVAAVNEDDQGHVARVELRAGGATVSRVKVGARTVIEAEIEVTGASDSSTIAKLVRQEAGPNPNAVLRLSLTGDTSAESGIKHQEVIERLAPDYFFVCPPAREYSVRVTDQDLAPLHERFVVGRYARYMRARLEETQTQEERQEIEDALQLGVALLQGKDVIE